MFRPEECYSEAECESLFAVLFPNGFAGEDVLVEIAPEGGSQSTLCFVFHPTLDQVHWEAVRLHRNLESFPWRGRRRSQTPEPTREEVAAHYQQTPSEVEREARELVGMCLWDVFSDGHEVVAFEGRIVDIGSFRGAAGFIADQLNRQAVEWKYDYMNFYMGTIWISQRADLTPVYEMIFRRLKERRFSWRYRFPKLSLVRFDSAETPDVKESLRMAKLEAELEGGHRQAIEEAKQHPPPATVLAYRQPQPLLQKLVTRAASG